MDPALPTSPADTLDTKPSFRKPINDTANRKYRRHSPDGGSDSSLSHGSPKREHSSSPLHYKDDRSKISDDRQRRDVGGEFERDSSRYQSGREHDSQKHSERLSYRSSQDFRRQFQRSSHSGRESKTDSRSNYARGDRMSDRSRDDWRNDGNYSRDKGEIVEYRSKNREREILSKDYDKDDTGSRQVGSRKDGNLREQDQHREREYRSDKRDRHRSPGNHRNDDFALREELRGYNKELSRGRDSGGPLRKEAEKYSNKDIYMQEDHIQKRKHNDWEVDKEKHAREPEELQAKRISSFSYRERDRGSEQYIDKTSNLDNQNPSSSKCGTVVDEKSLSGSKDVKENSETMNPTANRPEDNVDAAKVAALKAAELVNRNLVGVGGAGYLSTDQKKKLLWGNKKNSSSEESSNRWDLNLFSDRERQEKFNKLMSLSLPWCQIVGCEEHWRCRAETRAKGWKRRGQETGGARDRLGEAVYCRTSEAGWSDSGSWVIMLPLSHVQCASD